MKTPFEYLNRKSTGLCIGLDADLERMPLEYQHLPPLQRVLAFFNDIIALIGSSAQAFKIQKAFLDRYGGVDLMQKVVALCHDAAPERPVFIDCKIGDIEHTMNAHLMTIFEDAGADGVVVNPYMGEDVFTACSHYPERGVAVLVRTSNPGASVIQDVCLYRGQPLWSYVLDYVVQRWRHQKNLFPVLSGNINLEQIRKQIPDEMPVLYAGVGTQGGSLEPIRYLFNSEGGGVIVNSSRALIYPYITTDHQWRHRVTTVAETLVSKIAEVRDGR